MYFESPEAVLSNVRLSLIRDNPGKFASFLKSTDFNEGRLLQRIENDGKPVRYLRHADTLRQVGRAPLAGKIEKMVRAQTEYRVSRPPRKMLVRLPDALAQPKRESDSPAVNRFRDQLRLYGMKLHEAFLGRALRRYDDADRIIAFAEDTKKYDAYHSSTIEGYQVSEEEIQAIIDGKSTAASGGTPEEIRTKTALKGCLGAHNFVLEQIRKAFAKAEPLEESLITEIYAKLFSPAVEAGLLKKEELTRYRTEPVYLRLSRYVPPNHRRINGLMSALVEEVNRLKDPVVRAVLLHYGFVTVHPYKDGNGRPGRFPMNYVLGVNGMRWTTIRAEDKTRCFRALESGQVDGRIEPFGEFVLEYLRSSRTRTSYSSSRII